jgi:cell division protein FtsB
MVTPLQTITQQKKIIANLTASRNSLQTQLTAEKAKVTALASENTLLKQQISALQTQLNAANAKVTALTAENATLKAQLADTQQKLAAAEQEVATLKDRIVALEAEVAALKAQLPTEPPPPPPEPPPPPTDSGGWTVIQLSADARKIYVSSSTGNDANDGLTEQTPVKTIKKGFSLTRWLFPDHLLLARGDRWRDEQIGWIAGINGGTARSGRSESELFVFGDYGDPALPNPVVETKPSTILHGAVLSQGGGGGGGGNFIALLNIDHYAYSRDPDNPAFDPTTVGIRHEGLSLLNPIDYFLIEGCDFSFYTNNNIMPVSGQRKVVVRRTNLRNNYSINSHSQGLYTQNVANLILEDPWFDHNGYNEQVAGAVRTQFNHGLYHSAVAGNGPLTVNGAIFSRNSNNGFTANWGGDILNVLSMRNAIGFHVKDRVDGQTSTIKDTVVTESEDLSASSFMGWGITFGDMDAPGLPLSPIVASGVIMAHNASAGNNQSGYSFANEPSGITVKDGAIHKWANPLYGNPEGNTNVVTGMLIDAAGTLNLFNDPTRTVSKYMVTQGKTASNDAFYDELRKQRKGNWRLEYTAKAVFDYMKLGFAAK